ncbi:MAG: flagellin [Bacteriovoracaceae bacterium]
MGFRINTNVASISAQRSLSQTNKVQENVLAKLSSGTRISQAADDAAGLAISEKLKAQIRGTNQATRNANDGISMVQTAEGGLNEVSNILVRLRELSVQSASDTVGDTERKFSDLEYQNLKQEIERISQVTEFNGLKLLSGEGEQLDFQIGIHNDAFKDRISYDRQATSSGLDNLGMSSISVMNKQGAQESLGTIDKAIESISGSRANLGALQNRLSSTVNNLQVSSENMSAANSRIRDTDYAEATAQNAKMGILNAAGTSVLGQANMQTQNALKLIG